MEICGLVTEKNEPGMNSHVCYYLFAKLILLQYVGELKCFDILLLLSQYLTEFMFFSANKKKKLNVQLWHFIVTHPVLYLRFICDVVLQCL